MSWVENRLNNMANDLRVRAKGGHPLPIDEATQLMTEAAHDIRVLRSEVEALDPDNGTARERLSGLMGDISQICYAASWDDNISTELRTAKPGPYGMGEISERQVKLLHSLSAEAGGWWSNKHEWEPNP